MKKKINYKNNIAMIRRMRGYTQEYMAKTIGVSRPTYINIEKGLKELTVSQLFIILKVLDVDFDDLLGIDSENSKVSEFDYKKFLK